MVERSGFTFYTSRKEEEMTGGRGGEKLKCSQNPEENPAAVFVS